LINFAFLSFFWGCQKWALIAILKTFSGSISFNSGYNATASSNSVLAGVVVVVLAVDVAVSCVNVKIADWQAHRSAIFDIDWMPGENQLVTASGDKRIGLWDVASEHNIAVFHGHTSSVKAVHFLPCHSGLYHSWLIIRAGTLVVSISVLSDPPKKPYFGGVNRLFQAQHAKY